ncbi:hypothetical protein H0W26_00890 [Candidatus Dependentiae bacterium]|nr:hypothetical protein [Candidatus Dependentiae bacterium]
MKQEFSHVVKTQAYEIIKAKGATFYGIAACVAELCDMIIFDSKQVVTLSSYHEQYKVCMSLPVVLGRQGIEMAISYTFTDEERKSIEQSAEVLRSRISSIND